ncbi:MAG: hypothetical protein HY205_00435 [Nitrospirae bacterium]|nr:hypothetical protein [Nitrospirota bacterium]
MLAVFGGGEAEVAAGLPGDSVSEFLHRIPNLGMKVVQCVGFCKNGFTERAGRESTFWSLLDDEDQLIHRALPGAPMLPHFSSTANTVQSHDAARVSRQAMLREKGFINPRISPTT